MKPGQYQKFEKFSMLRRILDAGFVFRNASTEQFKNLDQVAIIKRTKNFKMLLENVSVSHIYLLTR